MGRKAKELGPLAVSRLAAPGLHFVGGVAGLALQVNPRGARSWVLRVQVGAKRRDMGLGGFPDVSLAGAREAAREARAKVREGIDPVANSRALRSSMKADQAQAKTFQFCALAYIDSHEAGWRNAKHAQQWRNTLNTYAYPLIGDLLVRDVGLPHVLAVLEPIWTKKTETASRLRGRLESILDWATTRGYRAGLNPARWKGHLDTVLPAASRVANAGHHSALPIGLVGAFMKTLRSQAGMSARALEFTILTAARSGEVRGARWAEIDLDAATWTVPGERMKAGKEHRVPLSDAALAILNALPHEDRNALVFASPRGGMLSDMSLTAVLRRMKVGAVPHGFRSSFRDWCAERTNYPHEVAEMALAHAIGDKVEAAYRRGDLFEKRRRLMKDWAAFCANPEVSKGNVISMNAAQRAHDGILWSTILIELRTYLTADERAPFDEWLAALRDVQARARIRARLARVQAGNFGDFKPLQDGVQELRIDHGPGYRVYLSRQGPVVVLLLCGSDKSGQAAAIKQAVAYLKDWRKRGEP